MLVGRRTLVPLLAGLSALLPLPAQRPLPPPESAVVGEAGQADGLRYSLQLPSDFGPASFVPVVLLLHDADADTGRRWSDALAQQGMVVVQPQSKAHPSLARLPGALRQRFHIAHGGVHLIAVGDRGAIGCELATERAVEFQSLSLFGTEPTLDPAARARLSGRRLCVFAGDGTPAPGDRPAVAEDAPPQVAIERHAAVPADQLERTLVAHLQQLQRERTLPGAAGEVDQILDDFHDAADKGDATRYFAILPADAVFLGTDASERWSGAEFARFAAPWFQRGSAWTYVPFRRNVDVLGDSVAWFDERLDNDAYGECRGSGVLQRRDGRWVLRQYNLTIPVPNAVSRAVVARIREFTAGLTPATTTVVLVRHAEKGSGDDPDLTDAGRLRAERLATVLRDLPITAVFASEFRRTQQTVAPTCRSHRLEPKIVRGLDTKALVQQIRSQRERATVLVAAHSNTIPTILQQFGIPQAVSIDDADYDNLFVVTLHGATAQLLRLHL